MERRNRRLCGSQEGLEDWIDVEPWPESVIPSVIPELTKFIVPL